MFNYKLRQIKKLAEQEQKEICLSVFILPLYFFSVLLLCWVLAL